MSGGELVGMLPRWVRPIAVGAALAASVGALGWRAIGAAVAPVEERVAKLESSQQEGWEKLDAKLDAIAGQVAGVRQDVAVLGQRMDDAEAAPGYAGPRRGRASR